MRALHIALIASVLLAALGTWREHEAARAAELEAAEWRARAEESLTLAIDATNAGWDLRERLRECEAHAVQNVSCL